MDIDYQRIKQIIEELRPLDEYQAYYLKDSIRQDMVSPLLPPIEAIIRNACGASQRVLDVGSGNGHTLLNNADLFERGVGIDESDYMLGIAEADRAGRDIRNVEFRYAKGAELPFTDEAFDFVFTERGPVGHSDHNLVEALRVLIPGGLIFVETSGDFNALQIGKERFEQFHVELQVAATFTKKLVFHDCYELFRHYCTSWSYDGAKALSAIDNTAIDKMITEAMDAEGQLSFIWHGVFLGGRKI